MLVATPGQTTSYPLHNSGSSGVGGGAPKNKTTTSTTCHVSSSATPKANSNHNLNNAVHKSATVSTTTATRHIVNSKQSSSDASSTTANNTNNAAATHSTTTTALMKTLSVRLNRGTEFLKGTVQKALISATAAAAATTSTTVTSNSTANANTATARAATTASSSTTTTSSATSRLIVPSSSFLKLYTVPPTTTHRYPEERVQAGSADSLTKEMCHFKPIRSAPTTLWKCGTKSRGGASLKHPKACLATKYNIDCDDPIIKDDGRQYSVGEAPKASSTLLTTIISTPSHQSAFVCLVAQMKNLVNIQAKQQSSSSTSSAFNKTLNLLNKTTTKNIRGRVARRQHNVKIRKSPLNVPLTQLLLRQRKSSFLQGKKLHVPAELIINSKSTRNKRSTIFTGNPTPLHILPTSTDSKPKLKENSKTKQFINIVALAHENNQSLGGTDADIGGGDGLGGRAQRNLRKRRISCDFTAEINERMLRKSARLSKDCRSEVMKITTVKNVTGSGSRGGLGSVNTNKRQARLIAERNHNSFSPPLTRSRLKQLMLQKKFDSATTVAANATTLDHRQQQQVV